MNSNLSKLRGENFFEVSNSLKSEVNSSNSSLKVFEDDNRFIRDEAIGEISIKDLEKEAISRTLRFFNTNRRKTAKSLGMSERTLYRKIDEYQLENKSKKDLF